jgi:hypothetical protein
MSRLLRLEWISVLYLALFVLAILSPRLVSNGMFGFSEENIEEGLIFTFGIVGLLAFTLYERMMERREKERDEAVTERDKARKELVSTYEYIGAVNRQIDALKKLANETATSLVEEDRVRKHIFQSLAASAAAHVRSHQAVIRIVALEKLRTIREFHVDIEKPVRVANRDLLEVHLRSRSHCFIRDEGGEEVLVIPSSRQDCQTKAFMLIPARSGELTDVDPGLLNVYANQAEVLFRVLAEKMSHRDVGPEAVETEPVV